MKPTLRQMQAAFWEHMTGQAAAQPAQTMFHAENDFAAADRMAIHADMYSARLLEALRSDFSVVHMGLGDDLFDALAMAYVRENPPRHYSISAVGASFAAFLHQAGLHAAADLAMLCWTRMEVFCCADTLAIDAGALGRHPSPESAQLSFVPALRVFHADHDVTATWRNMEASSRPGAAFDTGPQAPTAIAVWRAGDDVLHTTLTNLEARALLEARRGAPLAHICETFANVADGQTEALRVLTAWFADGWIARLE